MNWTLFHQLGSPKWFYQMSSHWFPWLRWLSLAVLTTALRDRFTLPDYLQGHSYRIIFAHVPASFLASAIYMMMAGAALVFLVWRIKLADLALKAMAPIGVSFCLLSLVSGAIWGKPTWGTW